ncbi:MAG: OsmC family peroxiredoxin, partial [Armatimonadota bacterium]|nr:OsmC family peroxiredoxin [Armatimonadota bacterium]
LGLDGAAPDLTDLTLTIEVTSPRDEREVRSLIQAWLERCPVYLALLKPMAVQTQVELRRG